MYSFEGQHRRKPTVSLRGNSRQEKTSDLLNRVHSDRHGREAKKRQQNAALIIQSYYRSYLCCKSLYEAFSLNYETQFSQIASTDSLHNVTRRLLFLCKIKIDVDRLISLCQKWLQMRHQVMRSSDRGVWLVQLRKLLVLCCRVLQHNLCQSVAIPLRMVEVFTNPSNVSIDDMESAILIPLSKHGIFAALVTVLERMVPSPEDSSHPSPMATSLLQIITTLITNSSIKILQSFITTVMARPLTAHVIHLIIPAIKDSVPVSEIISAVMVTSQDHKIMFPLDTLYCLLSVVQEKTIDMEAKEMLDLVETIGLLLEGCESDHMISSKENDLLYEPLPSSESCDPLESTDELKTCCFCMISSRQLATAILRIINHGDEIKPISKLCYQLLVKSDSSYHSSCIFQLLSLHPTILKQLWTSVTSMKSAGIFSSARVLQQLAGGVEISSSSSYDLIPQLTTFCSIFQLTLLTLHDAEFYQDMAVNTPLPFSLAEISKMSAILRDVMVTIAMDKHLPNTMIQKAASHDPANRPTSLEWTCLITHLRKLLKLLHERDSRRPFCPSDHWVSHVLRSRLHQMPNNIFEVDMTADDSSSPAFNQSVLRIRSFLKQTPFVFSFTERVKLFWQLVDDSKMQVQGYARHFLVGGSFLSLAVRREQLYSDAFSELASPDVDIRQKLRVTMINALELEEAGYGEGVFREFLSELIKEAFDPNRGLFCQTEQQELYPNPQAHMIMEDYPLHYYFIGRLLGKALYENLLVELPLASFFLCKMTGAGNVDIHYLASLDPQLYHNLLSLKQTSVADLGLSFSITNNDMGERQSVDLKPNGSCISVTDDNKTEYIHLVADYRLNKQLHRQCATFREGLASVVPREWLHMFSHHELQVLISGADVEIDVADLRKHTHYSGGYHDDHECIQLFWKVVKTLTDKQKRLLLKFVTSCSRPPLLGFKDLVPPFGIQCVSGEDTGRLPTASTCMNLLKLPETRELSQMREKLLNAVLSGAGFELS